MLLSKLMNITNTLVSLTCVAVLSEVAYQVYKRFKRRHTKGSLTNALIQCYKLANETEQLNKVLFFPDPGYVCRRTLSGRECRNKNCFAAHDDTSLCCLLKVLQLCKVKVDVCVYMMTCSILADSLVQCSEERGVAVRVITEEKNSGEEGGEMIGAQIGKLRSAGIAVQCSSSSYWMHHKFLVADDEVLVNGSFNWTNQAVLGNFENLIVTSERDLVQPFVTEFERLWEKLSSSTVEANNVSVH
ncbi:mitochondrial cardiolipin hydrolase [Parasteatoda tepidariorum]|uniref:mitochondrial cardiolipin hydrolase n=1 Tax=Parasteatoda tepidariorum TaxID=114398 RepID=UPI00077FBAA4|nr:mitochondrial cardiolipin hydrolase [Parasteatoda tepidariorum]